MRIASLVVLTLLAAWGAATDQTYDLTKPEGLAQAKVVLPDLDARIGRFQTLLARIRPYVPAGVGNVVKTLVAQPPDGPSRYGTTYRLQTESWELIWDASSVYLRGPYAYLSSSPDRTATPTKAPAELQAIAEHVRKDLGDGSDLQLGKPQGSRKDYVGFAWYRSTCGVRHYDPSFSVSLDPCTGDLQSVSWHNAKPVCPPWRRTATRREALLNSLELMHAYFGWEGADVEWSNVSVDELTDAPGNGPQAFTPSLTALKRRGEQVPQYDFHLRSLVVGVDPKAAESGFAWCFKGWTNPRVGYFVQADARDGRPYTAFFNLGESPQIDTYADERQKPYVPQDWPQGQPIVLSLEPGAEPVSVSVTSTTAGQSLPSGRAVWIFRDSRAYRAVLGAKGDSITLAADRQTVVLKVPKSFAKAAATPKLRKPPTFVWEPLPKVLKSKGAARVRREDRPGHSPNASQLGGFSPVPPPGTTTGRSTSSEAATARG